MKHLLLLISTLCLALQSLSILQAQVPGQPLPGLEQALKSEDPAELAKAARELGDPTRGAIVFYQPHLTCTKCHLYGDESSPLGPDLTKPDKKVSDAFLVESILDPSKEIRKGFETVIVITDEGKTITGLLAEERDDAYVLRDPADDGKLVTIPKDSIDEQVESPQSVMPAELVNQLANRQQFLDLVRYVEEIVEKGPARAKELEPAPALYELVLPEYEEHIDHAAMIADFDNESFKRGKAIYDRLCVNCHGTKDEPGSLPTSLRFASDKFRNGSDPHSMYKTLTSGFGMMAAQTWMVPQQKYDAIHYVRETYLKKHNPTQFVRIEADYLASLPKGDTRGPEPSKFEPWVAMDYGPNLTATYEIGKDASNFAYKGIAVRLDSGPGGVSRGHAWMIFDEDTMRMAAAWSGDAFIDYNAIMLNGKHGAHPRIVGQPHFENKTGPGWAQPDTGSFKDPRFLGRDNRPYGPLPRDWAQFKGVYHHGNRVIVSYTVGQTRVLEMPGMVEKLAAATTSEKPKEPPKKEPKPERASPIFTRTLNLGPRTHDLILQVAEQPGSESGLLASNGSDPTSARIIAFGPGAGAKMGTGSEPPNASTPQENRYSEVPVPVFRGASEWSVQKGGQAPSANTPNRAIPGSRRSQSPFSDSPLFSVSMEAPRNPKPNKPKPWAFDGSTRIEVARSNDFDMTHADYTITARIKARHSGTIFSKTAPNSRWTQNGKTLFLHNRKLAFDIGWVGVVESNGSVSNDRWYDVAMTFEHKTGRVRLYLDGKLDGEGTLIPEADVQGHVVHLGYTSPNFPVGGAPFQGEMEEARFYRKALTKEQIAVLSVDKLKDDSTPDELIARWRFAPGVGNSVSDIATGKHKGTIARGTPRVIHRPAPNAKPRKGQGNILVAGLSRPIPGAQWQATPEGQLLLKIPAGREPLRFTLSITRVEQADQIEPRINTLAAIEETSDLDLSAFTRGGPSRWTGTIATKGVLGNDDDPFASDVLSHPPSNPWFCRIRLTGFDFLPDGHRAAVCSWDGDVWMVTGIDQPEKGLTWQRIASGMFQPLGLKYHKGKIYVTCRDQLAILHDFNGDGETDFYESFNSDHQVTEHFHEFAMGLQTDAKGNFYYAKSARHAKTALVPHHGTLLRVSADGQRTDILAVGFRAANGVCINPDGSFFVTDQEGHWMPKNRINWVPGNGGYYGNFYGYHDVTDPSDDVMLPPLCWITNAFDRSPAELMWVTSDKWGPLKGSLLNTSYGYGMVYVVPHEKVAGQLQGGMCRLPIQAYPTGVMRGRFHPVDGQLYLCGMFAWAGSRTQPGGFYRLRYTGNPAHLPLELKATKRGIEIRQTDPIDPEEAKNTSNYKLSIWGLKRAASYGSKHYNEHALKVTAARLSKDGKTISLDVADIEPTWGMKIIYRMKTLDGKMIEREIHNSIHQLGQ